MPKPSLISPHLLLLVLSLVACGAPTRPSLPAAAAAEPASATARLAAAPSGIHGLAVRDDGAVFYADSFGSVDSGRSIYMLLPPYESNAERLPLAGDLPAGMLFHDGLLYVCDTLAGEVRRYDASMQPSGSWNASAPWSVTALEDGTILSVSHDGKLQRLIANGQVETLFDGLSHPFGLAPGGGPSVWISEQSTAEGPGRVTRRTLDGSILESVETTLGNPEGLALDAEGRLMIADTGLDRVFRRDADGAVHLLVDSVQFPIVVARLDAESFLVNGSGADEGYGLWRVVPLR